MDKNNEEARCGSCALFRFEDINGWGICDFYEKTKHCDDFCLSYKNEKYYELRKKAIKH